MKGQRALVAFATGWGPRHGGINSFNYDFLRGFAAAFVDIKVICVIKQATAREIEEASRMGIQLRPLPYNNSEEFLGSELTDVITTTTLHDLTETDVVYLGHDIFTGELANSVAKKRGAKSAVIHHMSYDSYKGYESGISTVAYEKSKKQFAIFSEADFKLAIGPTLRDELIDWFGPEKSGMLIPGLPEIEPSHTPIKWTVILFGRLSPETNKIKQTKLGIAAVARCERDAREDAGLAKKLRDGSRIKLFGVDPTSENELREYVEHEAGAAIDIHALPYTEDRAELFNELRRSSVAIMPSWHEGFGLVGWEAIAAGIPVILGRDSGLYKFLNEQFHGLATGCIATVDIRGSKNDPYFQAADLAQVVATLKNLASDEEGARKRALSLKRILGDYTPKRCAEDFANFVGWENASTIATHPVILDSKIPEFEKNNNFLKMPISTWDASRGYSYSQLLRAEEACVPFDKNREADVEELLRWVTECPYPLAIRLYTGPGGSGKTRLLLEASQRLSSNSNWKAGFLPPDLKAHDIRQRMTNEMVAGSKWLIGIDYAETRRDQLALIVEIAQKLPMESVRIVLLARDPGEWWERLPTDYQQCEHIFGGEATDVPKALLPLHSEPGQRLEAYKTALTAYAARLGIKDIEEYFHSIPDLRPDHYGRPLFLQMAALLALQGEQADSANGLTAAILRHEVRYWRALSIAAGIDNGDRIISALMTLSTLAGGLATEREAWDSLSRSGLLLPDKPDFTKLYRALCPLYPGRQGLQPLRPDLLGEALIAASLSSNNVDTMLDAALDSGITVQKREHALTVLTRSVRHRPSVQAIFQDALSRNFGTIWREVIKVGQEAGQPLETLACNAYSSIPFSTRTQVAGPVLRELRGSSVAWDALALLAADAEVQRHRSKLDKVTGSSRDIARTNYGQALIIRATAYHYSGNNTAALLDSQEANSIFRRVKERSMKDLNNYCWSLVGTSNRLGDLGQHREALELASEAAIGAKVLMDHSAAKYSEIYASVLTNLALMRANVGEYSEALECARLGVDILIELRKTSPSVPISGLYARALGAVSLRYDDAGDSGNCLKYAIESSEIYSELAAGHPDRYTLDYANSLINLGATYDALSDHDNGFALIKKATEILKPLAGKRPERFASSYAVALINLSGCELIQGKLDESLRSAEQAVAIYKNMNDGRRLFDRSEYASAIVTVALRHADTGNFNLALKYCELANNEMMEENLRRPGVHAARNIHLAYLSCLYKWLLEESCDIDSLKALELSERNNIVPGSLFESRATVMFMSACVLANSSRTLAEELFDELLVYIAHSTIPESKAVAAFKALGSNFIASNDSGNTQKSQDADVSWKNLLSYYPNFVPAWIICTRKKICYNEYSQPLNLVN